MCSVFQTMYVEETVLTADDKEAVDSGRNAGNAQCCSAKECSDPLARHLQRLLQQRGGPCLAVSRPSPNSATLQ